MTRRLRTMTAVIICCLLLSFCSCGSRQKKFSVTYFDLLDTYATITVYTDSAEKFSRYSDIFQETLKKYDTLLDAFEPHEGEVNIYTVNMSAAKQEITVGEELFDVLQTAKYIYELTKGYADVSLGSVTFLWKDAIASNTLPSDQALNEAAQGVGIDKLLLNRETLTVSLADDRTRIDVGAICKGYVSEKLSEALISAGCESFLLDLGGNLTAHGEKIRKDKYMGGIVNPLTDMQLDLSLPMADAYLSTSGSYNRAFMLDGISYHHIIDPHTLRPSNTFVSVSVWGPSGTAADALSTALFSMSFEEGRALIDGMENTAAVWIFADGKIETVGINASERS